MDVGDSRLRFASDANLFCRPGASLVVRPSHPGESLEDACAKLLLEWSEAEPAREAGGVTSKPFGFVACCPIRGQVGGHASWASAHGPRR